MILRTLFLVISILFTIDTFGQSMPDVCGIWCSSAKDCKVQLYKNGDAVEGKIIWLRKSKDEYGKPLVDHKNPNPELRNKPMVGLKVLWDAVYNPVTNYFENGIAYVKGREFCGKFKLNPDGTLSITGYICSLKFLRKTDVWTREK